MKRNRVLSVFVSIVLVVGLCPGLAYAQGDSLQTGEIANEGLDATADGEGEAFFKLGDPIALEQGDAADETVAGDVLDGADSGALMSAQETTLQSSGTTEVETRTPASLLARWNAIPEQPWGLDIFTMRNDNAAYTAGTLAPAAIAYAQAYLNFIRYAAGLSNVTFDDTLNANAAQGALILARLNLKTKLNHYPGVPNGVDAAVALPGRFACGASNLSWSGGSPLSYIGNVLETAIRGQLDDSDESNFNRVGHRRWLLNPSMSTSGIGSAYAFNENTHEFFTDIRVSNNNNQLSYDSSYGTVQQNGNTDYAFIAWPASGAFPNVIFDVDTPWSVSLNSSKYQRPSAESVRVEMTRISDGRSWTMTTADTSSPAKPEDKYLFVNTQNMGVDNCIIFNPGSDNLGVGAYEGSYQVSISGITTIDGSPATLSYQVDFTDMTIPMSDAIVKLDSSTMAYNGTQLKPGVTVTCEGNTLTQGTDYTVSYGENVNAGKGTVTVTGKGDYKGSVTEEFTISAAPIDTADVSVATLVYEYDGKAKEPIVTVVLDGRTLKEGVDYTVEYADNTEIGTATVTVTGMGNYEKSNTQKFSIVEPQIDSSELDSTSYVYNGTAIEPAVTVKNIVGETLSVGEDYELAYEDNVDAGEGRVIVTGKGAYASYRHELAFAIAKAQITSVVPQVASYVYDGAAKQPEVTVKDEQGNVVPAENYELVYENNRQAGTAKVIATAKGKNYAGSANREFTISAAPIDAADVSVATLAYEYDGKAKEPVVTVMLGAKKLVEGVDYTVSYEKNVNVGTASAIATGKGNYKGAARTAFAITSAKAVDEPSSQGGSNQGSGANSQESPSKENDANSRESANTTGDSGSQNSQGASDDSDSQGQSGKSGSSEQPSPAEQAKVMHRLYNPNSGEHFYTSDADEYADVVAAGWTDEGQGWVAPEKSNTPVYRMYNPYAGEHHYCMDASERDALVGVGWLDEGIGWYSDDAKTVPLYRDYNPNAYANNHNYTVDAAEHQMLMDAGWNDEGYAWFGV